MKATFMILFLGLSVFSLNVSADAGKSVNFSRGDIEGMADELNEHKEYSQRLRREAEQWKSDYLILKAEAKILKEEAKHLKLQVRNWIENDHRETLRCAKEKMDILNTALESKDKPALQQYYRNIRATVDKFSNTGGRQANGGVVSGTLGGFSDSLTGSGGSRRVAGAGAMQ